MMIVDKEEEEERKTRWNEIVLKVVTIQLLSRGAVATWSPPGEDHLSQGKKGGHVEPLMVQEEQTWCKPWGRN